MKKTILTLLAYFICQNCYSQILRQYKVDFPNGKSDTITVEDKEDIQPVFSISISPAELFFTKQAGFATRVSTETLPYDGVYLRTSFSLVHDTAYGLLHEFGLKPNEEFDYKPMFNWEITAGYRVISWKSLKRRSTYLKSDYQYKYIAFFERTSKKSIILDVGILSLRDRMDPAYRISSNAKDTFYGAYNLRDRSVKYGVSYRIDQHYDITLDKKKQRRFYNFRFYFFLSKLLSHQFDYFADVRNNSRITRRDADAGEPFDKPEIAKNAWRIGLDANLAFVNTPITLNLGIETGTIHHIKTENGNRPSPMDPMSNSVVLVHFGIGFGYFNKK